MGRRLFALLFILFVPALLAAAASASASRVLVLHPGGRVTVQENAYLPAAGDLPAGMQQSRAGTGRTARAARAPRRPRRTVPSELARLAGTHQVTRATYGGDLAAWRQAGRTLRHLTGTRARELAAVMANVSQIAAGGRLTSSRLPELFLTLRRNVQWWSSGPLPASGQRVQFAGSQIVWQYYPGQGVELQVLGTFGTADGLYTAGPAHYAQMRALVDEMRPLAADRGGALAWEYLFQFDGGSPPWVSAMAQGTAIEALTRAAAAARAQGDLDAATSYLTEAHRALAILNRPPPLGVGVATRAGERFLQYSFAPHTDIINAFLQTLIGLYDFATASDDPAAQALFRAGDAQARAELRSFDTGAWSLYEPGVEDDLSYHQLVTGFLHQLCHRTRAGAYCTTASHFDSYLKTPPALGLLTTRVRSGSTATVTFSLSKLSHVGIVILAGPRTMFLTSAYFSHGTGTFAIPALAAGSYTVHLTATDEAGNFSRLVATLSAVAPAPAKPRRRP